MLANRLVTNGEMANNTVPAPMSHGTTLRNVFDEPINNKVQPVEAPNTHEGISDVSSALCWRSCVRKPEIPPT